MTDNPLKIKFNKALQLDKNGYYPNAIKEYLQIIEMDNTFREAYINLGSLYSRMNMLSESMKCYKAALSLGTDYITTFNIGCIFYKKNEFKKAVIHLEKSISLNQSFILSRLVAGLSYSRMQNIRAAKTNFLDVLKIDPDNRVALTAISIIYYNEKQYTDAIAMINRLIKNNTSTLTIRKLKLDILSRTGHLNEALSEIQSIKQISDGFNFYDTFIQSVPVEVYDDKYGTLDDKIQFLQSNSENDKKSLLSLSMCHLLKGDTDNALEYLFKVKKNEIK